MAKITINDLLEAGCHFGHRTRRWNPKMKPYVYGAKNGIYIIDLTKTMRQLADACNFLQRVVAGGQDILFVGTKRQAQEIVRTAATQTGMHHITERWLGGTLTNNQTIRNSINRMKEIDTLTQSTEGNALKKKEISSLTRQGLKLHRNLDGIANMRRLPGALVVIDACHEDIAVKEANKLGIPIVALIDTNADPDLINYPVVANDDAVKSVQIITDLFVGAVSSALDLHRKRVAEDDAARDAAAAQARERAAKAPRGRSDRDRGGKKPAPRRRTGGTGGTGGGRTAEKPAEAPAAEAAAAPAEKPAGDAKAPAKKPAAKKPAAKKPAAKKPAAEAAPAADGK
jgi:small subunit ribosomal protein S2